MTVSNPPSRDVKLNSESQIIPSTIEPQHEQLNLSKKPRNYKYWSDEEVKKILDWLTLPENEGKLSRNKAQACREVAKKLFEGDEYMAISVRSKLMSLEKGYKEAEQLRQQLNSYTKDEALINEKIKEISKFYKECQLLFGGQKILEGSTSNIASPITPNNLISTSSSMLSSSYSPVDSKRSSISYTTNDITKHVQSTPFSVRPENISSVPPDITNPSLQSPLTITTLPRLKDDRLRTSTNSSSVAQRPWTLPPVNSVNLPPVETMTSGNKPNNINSNMYIHTAPLEQSPQQPPQQHHLQQQQPHRSRKRKSLQSDIYDPNVLIAKYAAKQASYAAKQAQYEAQKSEHERNKMEFAVRLAEIERDRVALSKMKLELELQLIKNKEQPS